MELKPLIFKFVKFGIVGASGMVVHLCVLYLCRDVLGINTFISNTLGFIVAATTNYILNRIWTFRSKEKQVGVEYIKFILVSVIGLGVNNGSLWLLSRLLPSWAEDWRFYILWAFAVGITTIWNFFGNLLFTFRNKQS